MRYCKFCGSAYLEKHGDYLVCIRCGKSKVIIMKGFYWAFFLMLAVICVLLICV